MSIGNVPSDDFSFAGIEHIEKGDADPGSKTGVDEKISGQVGKIASLAESSSAGLSLERQGKSSTGISRVAVERFRQAAAEKGMTKEEIDHQIRYISQNLDR